VFSGIEHSENTPPHYSSLSEHRLFNVGGSKTNTESTTDETVETYTRRGLDDVIDINNQEEFVLLIDDFHYMSGEVQDEVGEAIKQAGEAGLRICVALIPHRSDELTQANPDLQGRALTLKMEYWKRQDLMKIGKKGFEALNVNFPEESLKIFAKESAGSPHLMQQLCYDACGLKGITKLQEPRRDVNVTKEQVTNILGWTGASIDMDSVFEILNGEGISGKKQRNSHKFVDGTEGDVYEAILRGIASNKIQDELDTSDVDTEGSKESEDGLDRSKLVEAIDEICVNSHPLLPSITQALERMDERISETNPETDIFEYNDETKDIHISDPYLIFYLRWSGKIGQEPDISF
jgi:hypothetical protein